MKFVIKSDELVQGSTHDKICMDNIHIITQYFLPPDKIRRREIQTCIKQNVNEPDITNVHLLNERIYSSQELGTDSKKIIQTKISKRLQFVDVFRYIRSSGIKGFCIFLNADIYVISEMLRNLRRADLHKSKTFVALLRHDFLRGKIRIFGPRFDSQDTWILHTNYMLNATSDSLFSFEFGKPGCDNKLVYAMSILGYKIINDPNKMVTVHMHASKQRSYKMSDALPLPYGVIIPFGYDIKKMRSNLDIDIHKLDIWSLHFKEIMFDDNTRIRNYIQDKMDTGCNFVIPRISGIENNTAVFSRVCRDKSHSDLEPLVKYICSILPVMKNNAGIHLTNQSSIVAYSNMYLRAFEKCEMFAVWEPQGEYIGHIAQSHSFMLNTYVKQQRCWATSFDIFHYIYANPWTRALKGKRILVISPFSETIQKQFPIRTQLYDGVDLFPECELLTLVPPQTQADELSRDFCIEMEEFKQKVDKIMPDFDVALVSCGGYGNPICAHIYEKGKSAIYVGGVLQMYFGILGARWELERPEAVKLFHNEFWTRPTKNERPKNCKKVEGGCYW